MRISYTVIPFSKPILSRSRSRSSESRPFILNYSGASLILRNVTSKEEKKLFSTGIPQCRNSLLPESPKRGKNFLDIWSRDQVRSLMNPSPGYRNVALMPHSGSDNFANYLSNPAAEFSNCLYNLKLAFRIHMNACVIFSAHGRVFPEGCASSLTKGMQNI